MVNDVITLPQLLQMEALYFANGQQAHVGEMKITNLILDTCDWPALHKDVARYVNSCLVCQSSKPSRERMKFPLRPLQSGAPIELVQIDNLKLAKTESWCPSDH